MWGESARLGAACQRHATFQHKSSSVFSTRHLYSVSATTPHCAPLRYADVGLLGYRASGTHNPRFILFKTIIAQAIIEKSSRNEFDILFFVLLRSGLNVHARYLLK